MTFSPRAPHECAGIVLLQNSDFHFRLVLTLGDGGPVVRLIKRYAKGARTWRTERLEAEEEVLAEQQVGAGRVYFKVEARGQAYSFYVATEAETWLPLAERVDGRILSTPVAGGFVGAYIGMYASSNGQPSDRVADFEFFEYAPIEERA